MSASQNKSQNNNESETTEGSEARIYELGYLLVPTISPDDVPTAYGDLKDVVITLKGEILSDEIPKNINLAYPMTKVVSNIRNKFITAYFGWIKFAMSAEKVLELKKRLDLDPNIIRFMIIKTVKENTIAAKRFVRGDVMRRPLIKKNPEEQATPIDKEKIDQEIDALVSA